MPASAASNRASRARGAGTKITATSARMCATASCDAVEDGHARDGLAAVARRDAGDDVGPGGEHAPVWKAPSRPVMPCTSDARGVVDEDAHAPAGAAVGRALPGDGDDQPTASSGSRRDGHVGQGRGLEHGVALLGGVAVEAHDDGRVARAPP